MYVRRDDLKSENPPPGQPDVSACLRLSPPSIPVNLHSALSWPRGCDRGDAERERALESSATDSLWPDRAMLLSFSSQAEQARLSVLSKMETPGR